MFADGSAYTDLSSYLLHVLALSLLPPAAVMWVVERWTKAGS